jgi:hypothetical protein
MQLTATNGNRRNLIEGQRVTITLEDGRRYSKTLPAGNALRRSKYRAQLLDFAHVAAVIELDARHGLPRSRGAAAMVNLFACHKAHKLIVRGARHA